MAHLTNPYNMNPSFGNPYSMTDPFTNAYNIVDKFTTAVNQVITDIPDRLDDSDIAEAVRVLFRDHGAGANYAKLTHVINIIYDHALPTGARNDKMVSLLSHIVSPKPTQFTLVQNGRTVHAETLAHEIIMEICNTTGFTLSKAEVWDRRLFDIIAEFANNSEDLKTGGEMLTDCIREIFLCAIEGDHLFRKANFDLFAPFVIDQRHVINQSRMIDLIEWLQKVVERAESEPLDMKLMAAGLVSVVRNMGSA